MIGALCAVLLGASAAPDFDLLIRGGRVVDGTGNPSYVADVGIKQGRIAAVGRLAGRTAARTIDAGGLVVAPGFVDIHNHSDDTLLVDGDAESMVRQGVTTMILGEGLSAAPSARFPDFQAYFAALTRGGIATNVGSYIGSGTVWTEVHGARAGPPPPAEVEAMRKVVRRAMEQGALGVASSLSGPPGSWIDTDTLVAMCEVAGRVRRDLLDPHPQRGAGRVGCGGGGLRDRPARARARGHHPPQDRRAHAVEADAEAGRADRGRAGAGHRRAGERLPVPRGTERPADDHPALGPRRRARGAAGAAQGSRSSASGSSRTSSSGLPGWYNHYTAVGSWDGMLLVSLSAPEYKRFEGKRMSDVIAAVPGRSPRTSSSTRCSPTAARCRPCTSITPRRTCSTRCGSRSSPSAPTGRRSRSAGRRREGTRTLATTEPSRACSGATCGRRSCSRWRRRCAR